MREKILKVLDNDASLKASVETLKTLLSIESSEEFKVLFKTLNELVDQAYIIENKTHEYSLIKNTSFIVGQLDLKERGFGFVIDRDKNIDDVFIRRDDINGAMNRDVVLVYISKYKRGARAEGQIRRVIERKYSSIIGTLQYRNGMGILFSDDKTIKQEIMIRKENYNGAFKFDKVKARIINYNFKGKIECVVEEVIGNINDAGVDILSKILKYNIDPVFSDIVLEEANKYQSVSKEDIKGRTDLRDEMIITIDGDDSKDFDDAVIVKQLDNEYR